MSAVDKIVKHKIYFLIITLIIDTRINTKLSNIDNLSLSKQRSKGALQFVGVRINNIIDITKK
jgi:hypothetical protein